MAFGQPAIHLHHFELLFLLLDLLGKAGGLCGLDDSAGGIGQLACGGGLFGVDVAGVDFLPSLHVLFCNLKII